jgi:hypothetical protein
MGINHRGFHSRVPQQSLDRPNVLARLEQMGREWMPKAVRGEPDRQTRRADRLLNGSLDTLLVDVMPPDVSAARILGVIVRGKDVLPA